MPSQSTGSRGSSQPGSSGSFSTRFLLSKSIRRLFRSTRTEFKLFLSRPYRRRTWLFRILLVVFLIILFFIFYILRKLTLVTFIEQGARREETHFTQNVHVFLPKQPSFEAAKFHPCSWLYLEFGAKDGRHLENFFTNGNAFLEEYLRATQSSMRGFCALAFDANPQMAQSLLQVRKLLGKRAHRFNVYAGVVPAKVNTTETVSLQDPDNAQISTNHNVQSIALADTIQRLTFPWEQSGQDVSNMNTARGNNNLGSVVVRFNVNDIRAAYWYLELVEAAKQTGVMCNRIDRLVINFEPIRLDSAKVVGQLDDLDVIRQWDTLITPPISQAFNPRNGLAGLVSLAKEINGRTGCRTIVHLINEKGKHLAPERLTEREVFYAILAGQPTFDERVGAQTETWMTAVPQDRLTIFTNEPRNEDEMKAARGRDTAVVSPHDPSLEKHLSLMQSWSHLVRVRESWDRVLKHNKDIKWLVLVDDDTFVFPGGMREYLSKFDYRIGIWGGSGEQARIDNGDGGKFANWLRDTNKKYGGKHCYLPTENVPKELRGTRYEYGVSEVMNGRRTARVVSHMCGDMFCKMGCPAVPQGAAIVLSRALVESLRPHIEECERETSALCKNCGSQRLYMCVNRYTELARTLLTRGICRAPWKLEHREKFPFALTFHGFQRYHGMALSTDSIHGDMTELWQLGKLYEESVNKGYKESYLIPMHQVADLIGCHGQGRYVSRKTGKGECISADGIRLGATDGSKRSPNRMDGQRPGDRKGSA